MHASGTPKQAFSHRSPPLRSSGALRTHVERPPGSPRGAERSTATTVAVAMSVGSNRGLLLKHPCRLPDPHAHPLHPPLLPPFSGLQGSDPPKIASTLALNHNLVLGIMGNHIPCATQHAVASMATTPGSDMESRRGAFAVLVLALLSLHHVAISFAIQMTHFRPKAFGNSQGTPSGPGAMPVRFPKHMRCCAPQGGPNPRAQLRLCRCVSACLSLCAWKREFFSILGQ